MIIKRLLAFFFHHLYHSLAWGYDWVAWTVSLGRWNQWGGTAIELLPPTGPILEIGYGPGHFQKALNNRGMIAFGLDESQQMAHLARWRNPDARLVRGLAQMPPFATGSFQAAVAIFPAPYIFESQAAQQLTRLLASGGKLVILLAARPSGKSLPERFVRALFHITGETPGPSADFSKVIAIYQQAGFKVSIEWREQIQSDLLFLLAQKL
jgi:SAM-dependent methyltransferase